MKKEIFFKLFFVLFISLYFISSCSSDPTSESSINNERLWYMDFDDDFYSNGITILSEKKPDHYNLQDNFFDNSFDCNDKADIVNNNASERMLFFDNDCSSYEKNIILFDVISKGYNSNGFFGESSSNIDISYQEVISFISMLNIYYDDLFPKDEIIKSVRWSFNNLRQDNNGFMQNGIVDAPVRTSLYIFSLIHSCSLDSRLDELCIEFLDVIIQSAKWVSEYETPWSGNHDLAALLMLYKLYEYTNYSDIFDMYESKRSALISNFVHIDSEKGFWPEAPSNWTNRLLTAYIQTQILFAGYYLFLNEDDEEFREIFTKEARLFELYANMESLELDISDSYDFKGNNDDSMIPLGSPSVAWHLCLQSNLYCDLISSKDFLDKFFFNMTNNFNRDQGVTYYSDSYLRFGVIEEINDRLLLDGKIQ
jgi:hypothetical protein